MASRAAFQQGFGLLGEHLLGLFDLQGAHRGERTS